MAPKARDRQVEQLEDDALLVMDVERRRAWLLRLWLANGGGERPPTFVDRACREAGVSRRTYGRARRRLGLRVPEDKTRRDDGAAVRWRDRDRAVRTGVVVLGHDPSEEPPD